MEYTIRIKKDDESGWFTGQCEQLPGVVSQGKNLDELLFILKNAIDLALEKTVQPPKRKRIPVSKVYFEKGMYKELVPDPFNLAE